MRYSFSVGEKDHPCNAESECKLLFSCWISVSPNVVHISYLSHSKEGFELEDLDLSWCDEISEAGLNTFCSHPSSIKCVSFRHLPASDLTLMLIAENFRQLTHLVLSTVSDISDQAVVKLAENIPQLEVVDISWNSGENFILHCYWYICPIHCN